MRQFKLELETLDQELDELKVEHIWDIFANVKVKMEYLLLRELLLKLLSFGAEHLHNH